jgi:hypothetical protein
MSDLQKFAWTELIISVFAFASVLILYPWIGDRATAAIELLPLVSTRSPER